MLGGALRMAMSTAAYSASSILTRQAAAFVSSGYKQAVAHYLQSGERVRGVGRLVKVIEPKVSQVQQTIRTVQEAVRSRVGPNNLDRLARFSKAVGDEVSFLPANYLYYRMERHKAVSPEEKERTRNFASFYLGAPMISSIAAGYAMRNFSVQNTVSRAAGYLARHVSRDRKTAIIQGAQRLVGTEHRGIQYFTDRIVAAARSHRAVTEDRGALFLLATKTPRAILTQYRNAYRGELLGVLRGRPTSGSIMHERTSEMIGRQLEIEKRKYSTGKSKRQQQRSINSIADAEHGFYSEYERKMARQGGFARFLESMNRESRDGLFSVGRPTMEIKTSVGKKINITRSQDEFTVGSVGFNLGTMSPAFLRDSFIKWATSRSTVVRGALGLFGMSKNLRMRHSLESLYGSYKPIVEDRMLTMPFSFYKEGEDNTIFDMVARTAGYTVKGKQGKGTKGTLSREQINSFIDSRLSVFGLDIRSDPRARSDAREFLDTALKLGQIPLRRGDVMVHTPDGRIGIFADIASSATKEGKTRRFIPLGAVGESGGKAQFMRFQKVTEDTNSTAIRLIRNMHGYHDIPFTRGVTINGERTERPDVMTIGPGNRDERISAIEAEGLSARLRGALDFQGGGILGKLKTIFTKHRTPEYGPTLVKGWFPDAQRRSELTATYRSWRDFSDRLYEESATASLDLYTRMTQRIGSAEPVIDAFAAEIDRLGVLPSGVKASSLFLRPGDSARSDSALSGFGKIQRVLELIRGTDDVPGMGDSLGDALVRGPQFLSRNVQFFSGVLSKFSAAPASAKLSVADVLTGKSARKMAAGSFTNVATEIDEINAGIFSLLAGAGHRTDTFTAIKRDYQGSVDEFYRGVSRRIPLNNRERSAFYTASHLSKLHHEVASAMAESLPMTDIDVAGNRGTVSNIIETLTGTRDYAEIVRYYDNRPRYLPFIPWETGEKLTAASPIPSMFALPGAVPEHAHMPLHNITVPGGRGTQIRIAQGIMEASNITVMSLMHGFNRTANEMLGIGFSEESTPTMVSYLKKMTTKRILPFTALAMGYSVLDRAADRYLEGTPFGEGFTVFGANVLAGARLAAQNLMDFTHVTDVSKYLEDLMPGIITSPLSGAARSFGPVALGMTLGGKHFGPRGSLTGGIIGGAVGMLMGGGPLGMFGEWDISKSREETVQEFLGKRDVAVRSGRWWEMGCLTHDTLVLTDKGHVQAGNIGVGTLVRDRDGTYSQVTGVSTRIYDGTVRTISTYFNLNLATTLTPNHKVPVLRKYRDDRYYNALAEPIVMEIPVGDLHRNDFLEIPIPQLGTHEHCLRISSYLDGVIVLDELVYNTQRNKYSGSIQRSGHSIPDLIELDEEMGRLFGYFMAEGSLYRRNPSYSHDHVIETVHSVHEDDIVDDISSICLRRFGVHTSVRHKTTGKLVKEGCLVVRICCSVLARFFRTLLYTGPAGDKDIPLVFMNASIEFKRGFVYGYWRGDGHSRRNRRILTSSRPWLLEKTQTILLSMGIVGTIPRVGPNGYRGHHTLGWTERIGESPQSFILHDGRLYSKISEIIDEHYDGIVYDFAVDHKDHLFVAGSFLVHNSTPFEGTKIQYFRPHMYHLLRSRYKQTPSMKDSTMTEFVGAIAPDIYAAKNYYSRPYPVTAGVLSNLPVLSDVAAILPGLPIGGGIRMHQEALSSAVFDREMSDIGVVDTNVIGGLYANYDQMMLPSSRSQSMDDRSIATERPMARGSFEWAVGSAINNAKDIVGIRGFMMGGLFAEMTGRNDVYDFAPELASPAEIPGYQRSYWDLELGGILGASEVIRRYLPHKRNQLEIINPIRNTMPAWLPGKDYLIDFQHGDPYTLVPLGESRLPGAGYETVRDAELAFPIESTMLGESMESQRSYFLGDTDYMAYRNNAMEFAAQVADGIRKRAEAYGTLIKKGAAVYNAQYDIHASVDAIVRSPDGKPLPVKVGPKGFANESDLNAFLVMSQANAGLVVEVDQANGETYERLVQADASRFVRDTERAMLARRSAASMIPEYDREGKAYNLANAYSWLDRYRILADVAPYSDECREAQSVLQQQELSGQLSPGAVGMIERIKEQTTARKDQFDFAEQRFLPLGESLTPYGQARDEAVRQSYSGLERIVGAGWERLSHLRSPLTAKLLHKQSALEEYENTAVFGKRIKMWENPIEDFIKTYAYQGMNIDDPVQGALSWGTAGMLLGGMPAARMLAVAGSVLAGVTDMTGSVRIPERTQTVREINEQLDAVEYAKQRRLYQMTGDQRYLLGASRTITGMAVNGKVISPKIIGQSMPYPESHFIEQILNNVTASNLDRVSSILPTPAVATMYQMIGQSQRAASMMGDYGNDLEQRMLPASDSSVYDENVPLYMPAVQMAEQAGLNAHDAGMGWYRQYSAMARSAKLGVYDPNDTLLPRNLADARSVGMVEFEADRTGRIRSLLSAFATGINITDDGRDDITIEIVTTR